MKVFLNLITVVLLSWFCTGCVSYNAQYATDWNPHETIENPYFTLYLIGDAGNAPMDSSTRVFEYLKKKLD